MVIANPIYDTVFKRLMENQSVAKFFVETLLEEKVEQLEFKPQEFTFEDKIEGIGVLRVDFIATIKTDEGFKKVLIEIQKAKHAIDVVRFRNYLAKQYRAEDEIETATGKRKETLPIVTIYMLGFQFSEIEAPAIKISRQYIDLETHKVITVKNDFVEKLTHDSYVVQMPRIHSKLHTKLDELLSIFEQNYFVDDKGTIKRYDHKIDNEVIKTMVDILHYAGTDPDSRKRLEDEQEAYRTIDFWAEAKAKQLQEKIDQLRESVIKKDEEIAELKRKLDNSDKGR